MKNIQVNQTEEDNLTEKQLIARLIATHGVF